MFGPDRLILGRTLREHVGGRRVIPWPFIALAAPLIFIFGLNNMTESVAPEVGPWMVVSLIGVGTVLGLLAVASVTLERRRDRCAVPIWWVVVFGAVLGASRSAVTVWVSWEWGLVQVSASYAAIRMTTGALLGCVILPLALIQASVISTYLSQRRELELELRDLEVERMRQTGRSEALREALVNQVEAELIDVRTTVSADDAREMSRRLWETAPTLTIPSVRWGQVLGIAITQNPYPTLLAILLWTIAAFGSIVLSVGLVRALMQIALSVAMIAACFSLARWLNARVPRLAVLTLVSVIAVLIVWTGVVAPVLVGVGPSELNSGTLVATAVWIPVLVVTTGIVVSAVRSGDEVVQRLREAIKAQQVAVDAEVAETARVQHELATLLHGSVQSRLLAAAALIRQPEMATEVALDPQSALQSALFLLSQEVSTDRDFEVEVGEAVRSWQPLMQISVVGIALVREPTMQRAAIRVIEEGMSNAFRHGAASEVEIRVEREEAGLRIVITDNGEGFPAILCPGLGSSLLDSLAPRSWSLERSRERSTVLSVLLRDSQT